MRIVIAGVPRAGKTTLALQLAEELGYPVQHADDLIGLGWSEASAEIARRMQAAGPWIFEGVAMSRALRKALELTAERPCDRVYFLAEARERLSSGQTSMAGGCHTVHAQVAPELLRRGVEFASIDEHRASGPHIAPPKAPAGTVPAPTPRAQVRDPHAHAVGSRWSGFGGGRGFG